MEELTGFIDDVRHNNPLYLVTLPGRWNFKHDGNLATIIKGVLTLGESSKYTDPIYQPMKDNLGEGLGDHPISQGGLTHTSPRLE